MEKIELALSLPVAGAATAVAWSADGARLAAASHYGSHLTVWDVSGRVISEFDRVGLGPYPYNSLSLTNDGRLLITAPAPSSPEDAALTIWDTDVGEKVRDIAGPAPGRPRPFNLARNFALSPDGSRLAVAPSRRDEFAVTLYDTSTWQPSAHVSLGRQGVCSLAFSSDGKLLAVGTLSGSVHLVDSRNGSSVASFPVFQSPAPPNVATLSFSPDGRYVAVGEGGGIDAGRVANPVRVHDANDGKLIATYPGGEMMISKLVWVQGGSRIAFVNDYRSARIWNPNLPPDPGITFQSSKILMSIAAAAGGRRLAVTDDTSVKIYNLV